MKPGKLVAPHFGIISTNLRKQFLIGRVVLILPPKLLHLVLPVMIGHLDAVDMNNQQHRRHHQEDRRDNRRADRRLVPRILMKQKFLFR